MKDMIKQWFTSLWIIRAALVYKQYQPSLEWQDCLSLGKEILSKNNLSVVPSKAAFHDVKNWN